MSNLVITCPSCSAGLRLRDRKLIGRQTKCPKCGDRFLISEPATAQFEQLGGVERLQQLRKRGSRAKAVSYGLLAVSAVIATAAILILPKFREQSAAPPSPTKQRARQVEPDQLFANNKSGDQAKLSLDAEGNVIASSDQREPIRLLYVPSGAGIIINLHPHRLWSNEAKSKEFRLCMGPLAEWTERQIREICPFEPEEIDELLICLILGSRENPPQVAAVLHLVEERPLSSLIEKFPGKSVTRSGHTLKLGETDGFLIANESTIAIAPRELAYEMLDARSEAGVTDPGIEALLTQSDRERDLTLVLRPDDLRVHQAHLVSARLKPFMESSLDWMGEGVETAAWSIHLEDPISLEFLLRNQRAVGERQFRIVMLEKQISQQLGSLPGDVLQWVESLRPRTQGRRRLIGRFPAMIKAVSLATTSTTAERFTQFSALLPERAAPNLALASMLVWDESIRQGNTNASPVKTPSRAEKLPDRIAERMNKFIDVDFRRTPLEEAFDFIGGEITVSFVIDGKALEGAGYTRNMPQEFQVESVPATKALHEILKKYDQMVLVIDEQKRLVMVTTISVAKKKSWTPFSVEP